MIAFANCNGGKLSIGIRNDGTDSTLVNPDVLYYSLVICSEMRLNWM